MLVAVPDVDIGTNPLGLEWQTFVANLPPVGAGDVLKVVQANLTGDGYQLNEVDPTMHGADWANDNEQTQNIQTMESVAHGSDVMWRSPVPGPGAEFKAWQPRLSLQGVRQFAHTLQFGLVKSADGGSGTNIGLRCDVYRPTPTTRNNTTPLHTATLTNLNISAATTAVELCGIL